MDMFGLSFRRPAPAGAALALAALAAALLAAPPAARSQVAWSTIEEEARGQTVYFHAWAGDGKINDYIAWAGRELERRNGVTLEHVKTSDAGETVALVLAEKAAGRTEGGRVDLVWLNGENFAAMKENGLLHAPWVEALPNFRHVDTEGKPTTLVDFTVPTDGMEAPWGMAQLTFYYDAESLGDPPRSLEALAAWAEQNPGRFTYPAPPDFTGTTFLKQALITLTPDPSTLARPVGEDDAFDRATEPLWRFLDALHPHLWRQGQGFPANYAALRQLVDDAEVSIGFAFNPAEASAAIAQGLLPDTVRSFVLQGGSIGNTHFVAIPFNASAAAGAMVAANFLLSPEAQARKADPEIWGDPTVLAVDRLEPEDRARFEDIPKSPALLAPGELGPVLPEPHPSWMIRIEEEWRSRYSR
jgi:putative thiamine transport system substrate-binding protein